MKFLAIIPARGGSKGVPNKNIKLLKGNPLITYTIESALNSKIEKVIVSTDSENIAGVAIKYGVEVVRRPKKLSADNSPTLPVLQHVLKKVKKKYDCVVTLQPTSPFRTNSHINDALELFKKSNTDSLVSVCAVPHNYNPYSVMSLDEEGLLQPFLNYDESKNSRQFKPTFYARNGAAIYITKTEIISKYNSIYGKNIKPYFMDEKSSFDIDSIWDWNLAELIKNNI